MIMKCCINCCLLKQFFCCRSSDRSMGLQSDDSRMGTRALFLCAGVRT